MARTKKTEAPVDPSKDEHRGHGGSYVNEGGVNHDVEAEPARKLVERGENQVIRTVDDANQPAPDGEGDSQVKE